jgi:sodium/potassium-transporting ATPase subunit alpha
MAATMKVGVSRSKYYSHSSLTCLHFTVLFLKGAPDVLLSKCGFYMAADGAVLPIDDSFLCLYTDVYEGFGGEVSTCVCDIDQHAMTLIMQGERVLGFAMKPMDISFEEAVAADSNYRNALKESMVGQGSNPTKDLVFVGLVTLMDPPRAEVPQAVRDCHTAGVKVIMVTGDHPLTAAAIARNIGLITKPTRESIAKERKVPVKDVDESEARAVVVHGSQIPAMTDEDWVRLIAKDEIVFARTSPEQKLIIVKKLTEAGNVVAMTGDGVNDSPALKQAAIGVAMGMNGSDVAREAADIVLLDDNFASIVVGIREGRLLFANLKKSVAYTLTHLVPEVVPTFLWAFVGFPLALGSIQVLCIDLLTEVRRLNVAYIVCPSRMSFLNRYCLLPPSGSRAPSPTS